MELLKIISILVGMLIVVSIPLCYIYSTEDKVKEENRKMALRELEREREEYNEKIKNGEIKTYRKFNPNEPPAYIDAYKGYTKDGHTYNSKGELIIDDYLHNNNIAHITDSDTNRIYYPKHEVYNKGGTLRPDWIVGDTYIEYFGILNSKYYDKKKALKKRLAKSLGLKLICIYPNDLKNLDEKIKLCYNIY